MRRALAGLAMALVMGSTAGAQGFDGSVVSVQFCNSVGASCGGNVNFAATGPGIEGTSLYGFSNVYFDASTNRLTLGLQPAGAGFSVANGGYRFSDLNGTIAPFLSATIAGASIGQIPQGNVIVDANSIFVNLSGRSFTRNPNENTPVIELDVAFGPTVVTPEPGTYAMLGTGLLALGGVAYRRRKA